LAGRFQVAHHGLLVAQMLAHVDFLDAAIAEFDAALDRAAAQFQAVLKRVCTIPRVSVRTPVMLLPECGADMTVFRTPPTWPAGPGSVRATTPPADAADPAEPDTARSRCAPR
jgi:hypothetical protein